MKAAQMAKSQPALKVRTRVLNLHHQDSLLSHLPQNALTFIRDGEGLVARGEVLRLEAKGPNRFAQLHEQWLDVVSSAQVDDPIGGVGRGLIAFGALAFSDLSNHSSVLIIPDAIIGVKDGRAWVTQIWLASKGSPKQIESLDDFEKIVEIRSSSLVLSEGDISAEKFENLAERALERIERGEIEKVVIARDLVAAVDKKFDLRSAIGKLAKRYPNCWTYSVDGLFGASPELLVRVSHSQVSARVLAGTASRGTDPQIDRAIADALADSSKNKREHAFAVESLVTSLQPFCRAIESDPEPFSLALPNLWHLASDVRAVLNENESSLNLAQALHPTAAVAGTPTAVALELIEQLELTDRGRYAGPVGWLGADGDGEWAIALRGAQLEGNIIRAFAGCGLVAESEPAAELAETELKFQPIRYALS